MASRCHRRQQSLQLTRSVAISLDLIQEKPLECSTLIQECNDEYSYIELIPFKSNTYLAEASSYSDVFSQEPSENQSRSEIPMEDSSSANSSI